MKKIRKKRIVSTKKQLETHEEKLNSEKPINKFTEDYWQKEIDEKFTKQIGEDNKYLKKHHGTNKKNS